MTAFKLNPVTGKLDLTSDIKEVNLFPNSGFGVWSRSTLEDIGAQVTLTDVTNGVCLTADTKDLAVGKLFRFDAGDFNGEVYLITALTVNTSFTIHDTSKTDTGAPGTGYEVTPACIAADIYAFDGWQKKTSLDLYREHQGSNTKVGSFYSLKMVPSAQNDFVLWPREIYDYEHHLDKFRGRDVAVGVWIKSSTASDIIVRIEDGTDTYDSDYHTGGGDFEWLEVSATIPNSATAFLIRFIHLNAAPGTAYVSQPILAFGKEIGEGNYIPIPNEVIYFEYTGNQLNSWQLVTVSANTNIQLEPESNGLVPKGAKTVQNMLQGDCASVIKYLQVGKVRIWSQVVGQSVTNIGWNDIDDSGQVSVFRDATFNHVRIWAFAVMV